MVFSWEDAPPFSGAPIRYDSCFPTHALLLAPLLRAPSAVPPARPRLATPSGPPSASALPTGSLDRLRAALPLPGSGGATRSIWCASSRGEVALARCAVVGTERRRCTASASGSVSICGGHDGRRRGRGAVDTRQYLHMSHGSVRGLRPSQRHRLSPQLRLVEDEDVSPRKEVPSSPMSGSTRPHRGEGGDRGTPSSKRSSRDRGRERGRDLPVGGHRVLPCR